MTNSSGKLSRFNETNIPNNGTSVTESFEVVNSSVSVMAETSSPSPSPGKGTGLKKWKRIKRGGSLDGSSNVDNSMLLKRGLSNFAANSNYSKNVSAEVKQTSEGSVSSANAPLWRFGDAVVDSFGGIGDSGLVIGSMLASGTFSNNSVDHTGASKINQVGREMNRMKNPTAKNSLNSVNNGQQGKPRTDSSKKARSDLVKSEKENSHSIMESVLVQGTISATTNGIQSEEFEVTSDDIFASDTPRFAKNDKNVSIGVSRDLDPLVESILLLQSVQQELGKEVEKFKDIGNEDLIPEDLSKLSESGEVVEECFDIQKLDTIILKGIVNSLKDKLDDDEFDQMNYRDMEHELERLYKQKIEVEVEYIAMIQIMRIAVADRIKILEEKKIDEQGQIQMKPGGDAECKATMLKKQSKKLEIFCKDERLKVKSSVWKYILCLFLQLVLFAAFICHLSPHHADFVPT